MNGRTTIVALMLLAIGRTAAAADSMQWHPVQISFSGPQHSESDSSPNPFLDYRLQCTLTGPSGQTYQVAGFFDADGAGGTQGDAWKCRFSADEPGTWHYSASFRQAPAVAVSLDPDAGTATAFDGSTGTLEIARSDKSAPDFRAARNGRLAHLGGHYLQFLGSGEPWVKGGTNIPENLLAYVGFDNTPSASHSFSAHGADWNAGDPDWDDGAGRALIGALNALATSGANNIYFLPMNIEGDGDDTFPTLAPYDKTHYDTSKLAQWEIVFAHAQSLGIFLHFQLAETEPGNESYHDGGTLGVQRKLYYRELIARFGHHLGLQWDLGEENDYGTQLREAFAAYIGALDPYDHPITSHSRPDGDESAYAPLLGNPDIAMTALQISAAGLPDKVRSWRQRSAQSGHRWVVSVDEPVVLEIDVNDPAPGYAAGRKDFLWPTYMSGGGGFEWYVTDEVHGHGFDQALDDFGVLDLAMTYTRHARAFLSRLPLLDMFPLPAASTADATLTNGSTIYAVYSRANTPISVDLANSTETFAVRWFNPRDGTWHAAGNVAGDDWRDIGSPPFTGDAAALVVAESVSSQVGWCRFDADCDDGEPCTIDSCGTDGTCAAQPRADGSSCGDFDPCVGEGTCLVGHCDNAPAIVCDDGDPCNGVEKCEAGACSSGTSPSCDDGDACTQDSCEPASGCLHTAICGHAQIEIDSGSIVTACGGSPADTLVLPDVVVSLGNDRALVVMVSAEDDNADCDLANPAVDVSYGSVPLARAVAALSDQSGYRACTGIFYLLDPPMGTDDVSIVFPSNAPGAIETRHAAALVLRNVAPQPPEATAGNGFDLKSPSIGTDISTITDGALVLDVVAQGNTGNFVTQTSGQVKQWQTSCASSSSAGSALVVPSSGDATLAWQHSKPRRFAHALAAFAPALLAPTTTTLPPTTTTTEPRPTTTLPPTTTTTLPPTTTTTLPPCTSNADCDDANECTIDRCEPEGCVNENTCPVGSVQRDETAAVIGCAGFDASTITIAGVPVRAWPDRALVVSVAARDDDADCDLANPAVGAFYGSQTMELAVASLSGVDGWRSCNAVFYLLDPPVGIEDVTIVFAAGFDGSLAGRQASAEILYNVEQTPPEVVAASGDELSDGSMTTDVTTSTDGAWVIDVITQGSIGAFGAIAAEQVERWQAACGSAASAGSTREVPAAGPVTIGWTHADSGPYAHSVAAFAPRQAP